MRIVAAAACYFALVFAAGFVLGAVRVGLLVPRLGDLAATALELPVILAAAWIACGVTLRRFALSPIAARAAMGALAFALLIAAEFALAVAGFGRTPAEFLAALATPAGALGLAGQMLFAAFPALRRPSAPA